MGNTTEALSVRTSEYDLSRLEVGLRVEGYELEYVPETASTMEIARDFGLSRTVVVADHQTAGRGRHTRDWLDAPGRSVLMTYVEPWGEAKDPPVTSILPSHVFANDSCSALQELTGSSEIKLKWLNDFVARGKKIGGILLENVRYKGPERPYAKLFGIGINVHYLNANETFPKTAYGAVSLDELDCLRVFDRTDIILAITKWWVNGRNDLRLMNYSPGVFKSHDDRYQRNASLVDKIVRVSGLGPNRDERIEGRVLKSPLGQGLLMEVNGAEIELTDYNYKTEIEVL